MRNINKIGVRILGIAGLLLGFNLMYTVTTYKDDMYAHSDIISLLDAAQENGEVIYFGESSNVTFSPDDSDKRSISQMVDDLTPRLRVTDVTRGALHADVYYTLLQHIKENSGVHTIVVTMNLRSFNAQWIYSELETALMKSMVMLRDQPPLYKRFLLSFKGYDIKDKKEREKQFKHKWRKDDFRDLPFELPYEDAKEWDADIWNNGIVNPDGTRDLSKKEIGCHYVKGYAFQIDEDNPRIRDFDQIVAYAKKRGWKLIFNLMAENVEQAQQLIGGDLVYFMRSNRDFLLKRYHCDGVTVVDNLEVVPDEAYIDREWTTEHYAQKGRMAIAARVAEVLNAADR